MIQEEQNSKPTPPRILILSGWVGSGKSTFATQLEQANPNFVRICQDVLGKRQACESRARRCLKEGKSIIIDRQNFDRKQRLTWLRIAKEIEEFLQQQQQEGQDDIAVKLRVECDLIEFATPFEECVTRLRYRTGHETIHSFEEGIRVLKSISNKEWVSPDISEVESPSPHNQIDRLMLTVDRAYQGFSRHLVLLPASCPSNPHPRSTTTTTTTTTIPFPVTAEVIHSIMRTLQNIPITIHPPQLIITPKLAIHPLQASTASRTGTWKNQPRSTERW
ncbi:uncharacterized protein PGTG_08305 [Puccinia graminis f. sp. tritici CRL 75-36-700-3]|uniref:tRNA ligase kinase domain-containing protein n=1 Tax=Puccinia graminis f. sp. tritici (strain CRL 75-36-700-3 / race SCCL) TaxID=418459 RepID=E3KDX4_PUCGT|nr:uncharacterized protein PGTG_08305 [Puccinia graminis f. sp. tritici CRL 75-36-700-3]EFP82349.1 hypothetical protein PGTG_08305 [Puccinia graminis f. sp. tritici CRL 75-36-700-3]